MSISRKLLLSYILISILIGTSQYAGMNSFRATTYTINNFSDETIPLLLNLENLQATSLNILAATNEYALIVSELAHTTNIQPSIQKTLKIEEELILYSAQDFHKTFVTLESFAKSHPDMVGDSDLQLIITRGQHFLNLCLQLINRKIDGAAGAEILNLNKKLKISQTSFLSIIKQSQSKAEEGFKLRKQLLFKSINDTKNILYASSFAAIFIVIISGFTITKAISFPISILMKHVEKIGNGDLNPNPEKSFGDEFGTLSKAISKMASDLAESLSKEKDAIRKSELYSFTAAHETTRVMELQEVVNTRDKEIIKRIEIEGKLHLAANIIDSAINGILLSDLNGTIVQVNSSFTNITGYSSDEALGNTPSILKSGEHDDSFYKNMWDSIINKGKWHGEIWNRHKNGNIYPQLLSISAIMNDSMERTHYVAVFHDLSDLKKSQEQLEFQAFHDKLTNLPNRELFADRLRQSIEYSKRRSNISAVLYLDIDNFKYINDTCGHFTGDLFLKKVAVLLKSSCRTADTVARLGGDEFAILLDTINIPEDAIMIAKRIEQALAGPFDINNKEFCARVSIGITYHPNDGDNVEALIKNADMAMYHAKSKGKNTFHVFTEELEIIINEKISMETALKKAIQREEFQLYYQPKININSGEIIGCEALIRWIDSSGKVISPLSFIPLAEETKLIIPIGNWVLETACTQAKIWHDEGFPLKVAVNFSAHQFADGKLAGIIKSTLAKTQLSPWGLELEVTESLLMENQKVVAEILEQIRRLDVTIAIDDFGTGYSSLAYLKSLPIDVLKIDRSFIKDIPEVQEDIAITKAILSMAKALGLKVVAEGVETNEQLMFLRAQGCGMMQGYLFSPPLPVKQFNEILQEKQQLPEIA